MDTRSLTTWRQGRSVGMPACGLEVQNVRPFGLPVGFSSTVVIAGLPAVDGVRYQEKHNPRSVGVASS